MTPLEFAQRYLKLNVYTFPQELSPNPSTPPSVIPPVGWNELCVDSYRLGASTWDNKFWDENIVSHFKQPVTVRVKTIDGEIVDHTFTTAKEARRHFHPPFVGKGSPEQAQIAIQLVYRFRPVSTTLEQFAARGFIGLDCNGFIGNYVQRVVQKKSWLAANVDEDPGPTTLIGDLLRTCALPVKDMDQLDADGIYLFGMCGEDGVIRDPSKEAPTNFGHIMITEPGTYGSTRAGQRITVVEATAAGESKLRTLDYFFTGSTTKGVFRVIRGIGGPQMSVRVARLRTE
jgi:hypothetical protein